MNRRPFGFSALWLLLIYCALAHAQTFRFSEPQGPHAVGLRVVEQYDSTHVFRPATDQLGKPTTGEMARPLQTLIWYPALKSANKPMTVADYAEIAYSETTFGKADPASQWHGWFSTMTPVINDALWAHRDAPVLPGRFPVVLYAPSFSALASENVDLCEYLASHGYVVIASPSMGATTRDMTGDLEGIEAQARDITYLLSFARTLPDTNMEEIAAAGFSWGGISELFAASRDRRIKALVALDGSMRYFPGLVKQSGFVHPEHMAIPMIFFTQGDMSLEEQARYLSDPDKNLGPSVLNAWIHGDLVTVHDLAMTHQEHSALDQRNEDIWKQYANNHKADYTRVDGTAGYAWMARYTLSFLDAYLKQDPSAVAFLRRSPRENGAPPHLLTAELRAAKGPPPTLDAFRAELGRQGFDHAAEVFAELKKSEPDFKLDETTLNDWRCSCWPPTTPLKQPRS